MAQTRNGTVSRVIGLIVAGTILTILVILLQWGPAIQDNTHAAEVNRTDINRVDKRVDMLIMKGEKFIADTTKAVSAIETSVAVIKTELKAHNEHHNP